MAIGLAAAGSVAAEAPSREPSALDARLQTVVDGLTSDVFVGVGLDTAFVLARPNQERER